MRKLFSTLAVVLIFAMAFTITASAAITGTEVYQPVSGKYTITAQDDDIKGAMVGMVVVESVDVEEDEFTEDNIRYIDQVTADAAGNISFPAFTPMDKKVDTNKYLVYVGGGELKKATKLGMLTRAPETVTIAQDDQTLKVGDPNIGSVDLSADVEPADATGYNLVWASNKTDVATVTTTATGATVTAEGKGEATITVTVEGTSITDSIKVTVNAPDPKGVTLDKETAEVKMGKTLTLEATTVPTGAEGTLDWESTDTTKATVVNGVVTPVAVGETTITVSIAGTSFSASCVVTVKEASAEPEGILGDINGDEAVDIADATYLFNYSMRPERYPIDAYEGTVDFEKDNSIDIKDATYLFNYSMRPERYPISWE